MTGAPKDAARREGRGRLSSLEMLPEEANEHIAWANVELRERKMPQTEILKEFNARLANLGIKGVSKGAFSRYSVRVAIEIRKMGATRQITDHVLSRIDTNDRNGTMIAAVELLKHRIVELVMDQDEPDLGLFAKAALTLQRLSSTAARTAEDQRRDQKAVSEDEEARRKDDEKRQVEADAETVAKIATEAGLSAERVAAIRKGVLGLAG